mmetsp:Transcript_45896/g.106701  ORF Transcript_45896/g.106701 Transcript_45896/m.106701 type:complete len:315 (-) Transcript_45896:735-1679(-)
MDTGSTIGFRDASSSSSCGSGRACSHDPTDGLNLYDATLPASACKPGAVEVIQVPTEGRYLASGVAPGADSGTADCGCACFFVNGFRAASQVPTDGSKLAGGSSTDTPALSLAPSLLFIPDNAFLSSPFSAAFVSAAHAPSFKPKMPSFGNSSEAGRGINHVPTEGFVACGTDSPSRTWKRAVVRSPLAAAASSKSLVTWRSCSKSSVCWERWFACAACTSAVSKLPSAAACTSTSLSMPLKSSCFSPCAGGLVAGSCFADSSLVSARAFSNAPLSLASINTCLACSFNASKSCCSVSFCDLVAAGGLCDGNLS